MYRKGPGPSNLSGLDENPDSTCTDKAELPVYTIITLLQLKHSFLWMIQISHHVHISNSILYHMPTAHSLLWLVRSWSHDHLLKLILGCNITFQHSDSELSGSCAQFSIWTLEKEPNKSELRKEPRKLWASCKILIENGPL